jgi:hypothetical protein
LYFLEVQHLVEVEYRKQAVNLSRDHKFKLTMDSSSERIAASHQVKLANRLSKSVTFLTSMTNMQVVEEHEQVIPSHT